MRSPEWQLLWWESFAGPRDELCVLLFHEPAGQLVGLAPLFLETRGNRKTVRLLGSGEVSTCHTTWLAAAGWQDRVSREVARFLAACAPSWDCLRLDAVDADDENVNATVRYLADDGFLVHRTPIQQNWCIALPATWEEYLGMLSKTQRKRCRKLQRLYFDSGRVSVHRVAGEAEFERGFQVLLRLHAARWGEATRPMGCFSAPNFLRFHEKVARELLRRKQLSLAWLEYEGKPVAAEYQFLDARTVYSYQAGMDPSVTELPPGNLSIMASIQFAIAGGFRYFDLSRGDQPYKANWRATPKQGYDIRIWPGSLAGRVKFLTRRLRDEAERGRISAARWVKSRVPERYVERWRELTYTMGGKRMGPRKVGDTEDAGSED